MGQFHLIAGEKSLGRDSKDVYTMKTVSRLQSNTMGVALSDDYIHKRNTTSSMAEIAKYGIYKQQSTRPSSHLLVLGSKVKVGPIPIGVGTRPVGGHVYKAAG